MIELFEHNKTAYEAAIRQIADTGRACVIHPTGTGKSFIAFKWTEDNPEGRFVWISPSENIYNTQLENVRRISGFEPENITFISFERLMLMSDEEVARLNPTHAVIDEFHRAGAERWEINVRTLMDLFPAMQVLGLSATPVRYLDNQRDMAAELFDNCIADQMSLGEAIVRGILPAPKYIVSLYSYGNELNSYRTRLRHVSATSRKKAEDYLEQLRRALEKAEGLNRMFARHMSRGRYLVFCANKEHLDEMLTKVPQWFGDVDPEPRVYSVWADSPTAKADYAAFKADDSDHLRLLYCIDMFNEGVHVDKLDGVILFRPTISPIIYKQQIGRALSASKSNTPVIFDVVNNFENLYSISSLQDEMREMVSFYRNNRREDEIVADSFEIIDEVRDCRRLFAEIEETLGLSWEMMYRHASDYYKQHGNLDVPVLYRTEDGIPLGTWIQTQRRVYSGKANGMLNPERIALLDKIGMIWDNRFIQAWEKGYSHAKQYRQENGNLDVPAAYVCEDGYRLGAWIKNLRASYKSKPDHFAGEAWQERREMLEALGMTWEINNSDEAFETGYREAKRYYDAHGTLDVPSRYTCESGFCLGKWIVSVRRRNAGTGRGAPLTIEQVQRLEAIGMKWQGQIERRWEKCFAEAERYFTAHGDLLVPADYGQNGVALWKWLRRQASSYGRGELDPARVERLEAIGMTWKSNTSPWDENCALARGYFEGHGDLEIPLDYVAENGTWLGKWLSLQRIARERGELDEGQISRLNAIGMRWESASDLRWKEAYEAVSTYVASGLPLESLPLDATTDRGTNLSRWLKRQQQKERNGKLTMAQSSMLRRLIVANQR